MSSPHESEVLQRRFSPERLNQYVAMTPGDLTGALDMYAWNAELVAALTETIGHAEVILRNALHEALTTWSAVRFGEPRWYLDPGHYLHGRALADIDMARRRVAQAGRTETPGRVVAELSMGFWRYLLASHYDRTLWRFAVHNAFPGQSRRVVHDAATVLHLCRNRLAHHEPIHNRPVADIRLVVLALVGWICPVSRAWIDRHCRVEDLLIQRPLR